MSVLRRLGAYARNTWRTLTSMGTALVLLFLLALGAIPGALVPQRSTGILTMRATVHNQSRELVLEGEQKYLLRKRPTSAGGNAVEPGE